MKQGFFAFSLSSLLTLRNHLYLKVLGFIVISSLQYVTDNRDTYVPEPTAKKRQAVNLFTGKSIQNGINCQKGIGGIEKITKQAETSLNSETFLMH